MTKMDNNEAREMNLLEVKEILHRIKDIDDTYPMDVDYDTMCEAIDCAIQALGDGWVSVDDIPSNDDMDDMVNDKWENPDDNGMDEMENEQLTEIREAYLEGLTDMRKRLIPSPPKPKQP